MAGPDLSAMRIPAIVVARGGVLDAVTPAGRDLLGLESARPDEIETRFEVCASDGRTIPADRLPWVRLGRGEEFGEEQIWFDRLRETRLHLRVVAYARPEDGLLVLDDVSTHEHLLAFIDLSGAATGTLLAADDESALAHTIAEQAAAAVPVDKAAVWVISPGGDELVLLGAVGFPERDEWRAGASRVPLNAPMLLAEAARRHEVLEIPRLEEASPQLASLGVLREMGMRAAVAAPLMAWDELVGVLFLARRHPGKVSPLGRRILSALSFSSGLALSRQRARAAERQAFERLRALKESARTMVAGRSLDELLEALVRQACVFTGSRVGVLGLSDREGKGFSQFAAHGIDRDAMEWSRRRMALGPFLAAMREGKALRASASELGLLATGLPGVHPGSAAALAMPLVVGEQTYGGLCVASKESGPYTEEDEWLLGPFCQQAALVAGYAREAERAREQQGLLAAVLDRAPDGILFHAAPEGGVVMSNPVADTLLGKPAPGDALTTGPRPAQLRVPGGDALPPEALPSARVLAGEGAVREEVEVVFAGAKARSVVLSAAPVRVEGGRLLGAVVVAQDVTMFKELNRQREELAAVVAHDLRNPIQALQLQIDAAAQRVESGDVATASAVFDRMRQTIRRLGRLADDLTDASHIELGRLTVEPKAVRLPTAVQALVKQIAPTLSGRAVGVTVVRTPPLVWVDPIRLDQILTNLLQNAAKYSAPGAEVRVVVESRDDGAEVSVCDEGPGIAPDDLPYVFDRFWQSKGGRRGGGLGLGLYITRGLVEAHGGRLWAESTPGQGSVFHAWLPRAPDADGAPGGD